MGTWHLENYISHNAQNLKITASMKTNTFIGYVHVCVSRLG